MTHFIVIIVYIFNRLSEKPVSYFSKVFSAFNRRYISDYNNTFEGPNFFKGWKLNITGGYTWQYNRGPTISKGTGPSGAYKGNCITFKVFHCISERFFVSTFYCTMLLL